MHTPSVPVSWAWALTAKAATSSWRTPTHSMRSSVRIASVRGLRASPTTPQTWVTPASASEVMTCSATVVMGGPSVKGRDGCASQGSEVQGSAARAELFWAGRSPVRGPVLRRLREQLARRQPVVELRVRLVPGRRDVESQLVRCQARRVGDAHRRHDAHGLVDGGGLVAVHALAL